MGWGKAKGSAWVPDYPSYGGYPAYGKADYGKAKGKGPAREMGMCSVHSKKRSMECLVTDDETGELVCIEGSECKSSPADFGVDTAQVACTFFQKGLCNKGDECPYSHADDAEPAPAWSAAKKRSAPYAADSPAKRAKPYSSELALCSVHGKKRQIDCLVLDDETGELVCIEGRECKTEFDTSTVICKFWQQNKCTKGDDCPFAHDTSAMSADESWALANPGKGAKGSKGASKGGKSESWKGASDPWAITEYWTAPPAKGKGKAVESKEMGKCTLHDKRRAMDCLAMDEETGQLVCIEGNECRTSFDTTTVICKFWQKGECTKGDECTFAHDENALSAEDSWALANPGKEKGKGSKGKGEGKKGKGKAAPVAWETHWVQVPAWGSKGDSWDKGGWDKGGGGGGWTTSTHMSAAAEKYAAAEKLMAEALAAKGAAKGKGKDKGKGHWEYMPVESWGKGGKW